MKLAQDHLKVARDKLESAEILLDHLKFSDATSRAYYAIFHSVKALLSIMGVDVRTHKGTFYMFYKEFVEKGLFDKKLYRDMAQLQHSREDSDYGVIADMFDETDARKALETAKKVLEKVNEMVEAV